MHKLDLSAYRQFSDLDFKEFETLRFSVYVLNHQWEYLYVNEFAENHLGRSRHDLLGKNMWAEYPTLAVDPNFSLMRQNTEAGRPSNILANSPIAGKRLNILGKPLSDCHLFFVSVMPVKEALIDELRSVLKNRKTGVR